MDKCMDRLIDWWMYRMEGQEDEWINEWVHGSMDG